jgi:transposase
LGVRLLRMSELTEHYRGLLGLDASWRAGRVDFSFEEKQVEIVLEHGGGGLCCPECGVKTVAAPWADKHSRFTLLFEAFAIKVL